MKIIMKQIDNIKKLKISIWSYDKLSRNTYFYFKLFIKDSYKLYFSSIDVTKEMTKRNKNSQMD